MPAPAAPCEDPFWKNQHQRISHRIATLSPKREVNDAEVDAIIMLKRDLIDRMAQLDDLDFWTHHKQDLVADGILNKGAEFTMKTLDDYSASLTTDGGGGSQVFQKLLQIRKTFESKGTFY